MRILTEDFVLDVCVHVHIKMWRMVLCKIGMVSVIHYQDIANRNVRYFYVGK